MSEDNKTEVNMVKAVFSNDKGRELLAYWDKSINRNPSYFRDNTPEQTAFNEGVRGFILFLLNTVEDNK